MLRQTIISLQTRFWNTARSVVNSPASWESSPQPKPFTLIQRFGPWFQHYVHFTMKRSVVNSPAAWESSPIPQPPALIQRFGPYFQHWAHYVTKRNPVNAPSTWEQQAQPL